MPQLTQLMAALRWQEGVAIVGLLFGFITLIAYLDQRRSMRATSMIAAWAERNLEKAISEETLREHKFDVVATPALKSPGAGSRHAVMPKRASRDLDIGPPL